MKQQSTRGKGQVRQGGFIGVAQFSNKVIEGLYKIIKADKTRENIVK